MNKYQIFKENLWHRIFSRAAVIQQRMDVIRYANIISKSATYLQAISSCDSLLDLLALHKDLWSNGFQNTNLAPDKYGMFRTKAIPSMTADEVYLGNIYGLWTFPISKWEEIKGGNNYLIVLSQYKHHLESNVKAIAADANEYLDLYHKVNPKIR